MAKSKKTGAKKAARAAKGEKPQGAAAQNGQPRDAVVGGTPAQAGENKDQRIPEEALIKHPAGVVAPITDTAEVKGDKSTMIIDVLNNVSIEVFVMDAQPLLEGSENKLVFVESNVTHEVLTAQRARGKFATKPDGTVIYNGRGFDDVPGNVEFDLVDIVKLIELRGKGTRKKRGRD